MTLKLNEMAITDSSLSLRMSGEPAELSEVLQRLVSGTLLSAAGIVAAPKPATVAAPPATAKPATVAVAAKPVAAAPAAPVKPAPVAVAAPKPKPVVAPVVVVEPDPEDAPAAEAPSTEGIPPEILNATRLREVMAVLQAAGITAKADLLAWCQQNQAAVPCLAKIDDLADRFERACVLIGVTA